ncbi:Protoheme IX farnesyltransferase, mitochondrial [Echinococcus granulosus]|nr:Protoheme IX farnesyltransferase, mitochondrial [Echinococcus granulosus]
MPSIKLKKSSKRYRIDPELRRSVGRAAPGSVERLQYLEALVNELCVTNLIDYKQQIVANLGNFAHDPRNCPHLISLDVHLIFLEIQFRMIVLSINRSLSFLRHHPFSCLVNKTRFCYASRRCSNFDVSLSNNSSRLTSTMVAPLAPSFAPNTTVFEQPNSAVLSPISRTGRKRISLVKWVGVWMALSKARLTGLVVSTALAGCALAAPSPLVCEAFLAHPAASLLALGLGTTLTSASANSINQIMEVQYDSLMKRTRMRPLVRKLISPVGASVFASTTATMGLSILYVSTNSLVASLAAGNLLLYTCVYTPLKRISQVNTWVGSLVGAIPPLMGWAAATGSLHSGSLVLACLVYAWQFPHFMSLSWLARQEYAHAGYVMTANVTPQRARAAALRHSLLASLICFLGAGGASAGQVNWCGGLVAAPFNAMLVYYALRFYSTPLENAGAVCSAARGLFRASLLHLPAVMTALLVCSHCGFATGAV